jgi:8-oxo-dGTP pyrophosphatase MutT (NUDIX family)
MTVPIRQAAAIALKDGEVCLITSSSGKRWVIPKGLIDPGHTAGEAALQEAWEEAGLTGHLRREPIGSYVYSKYGTDCHVTVFVMLVTEICDNWPERGRRDRVWVTVPDAAERVEEAGLRELLRLVHATEALVEPA